MVKTDFTGNYVNLENTQENDIMTICSAGKYEDKKTSSGRSWKVFIIDVDNGSKTLEYSPSISTGKRFQAAWGVESLAWLGKKIKFKVEKKDDKQYLEAYPVEEKA